MKAIVLELGMVGRAGDVVRRQLFPDIPAGDDHLEKMLAEELTILLSIYLNLNLSEVDVDYVDECDYYHECAICFDDLVESRLWNHFGKLPLKRIEVMDASGVVVVWPEPPKQELVRHVRTKPTYYWQHRLL